MAALPALTLIMALIATPVLAAPSEPSALAIRVLEEVCPSVLKDDFDAVAASSEPLGFTNMMGAHFARTPLADVIFVGSPVRPDMPGCQISVDFKPAATPDMVATAEAWARTKGLKAKGPPARHTGEDGESYTEATWSGAAGRLLIRVYPPSAKKRVNVTVEWHAA